jgi:hypothetical protein
MKECDVCFVATPKRPWPQRAYVPLYPIPSREYILCDGFEFGRDEAIVGKLGRRRPLERWPSSASRLEGMLPRYSR